MATTKAIELAKEKGLDLVLVAEKAQPPVARIMDFGKYKYETEKALKKQKAQQKVMQLKEIRLTPNISKHDLEIRIEKAKKFLSEGDMVKLSLRIFGRNLQFAQDKEVIIKTVTDAIKDVGKVEGGIKKESNMFLAIINPIKNAKNKNT